MHNLGFSKWETKKNDTNTWGPRASGRKERKTQIYKEDTQKKREYAEFRKVKRRKGKEGADWIKNEGDKMKKLGNKERKRGRKGSGRFQSHWRRQSTYIHTR